MTTKPTDNVVIRTEDPLPMPIDKTGSNDINQGDLVYMDTTAHQVKPLDTDAHANGGFAGVAAEGSYIQPYATKVYSDQIPVYAKGTFRFKSTAGDTMHDGDTCFIGADAQTITTTDPGSGHSIGVVHLAAGITSLAGGTTVTVEVRITALWPKATV